MRSLLRSKGESISNCCDFFVTRLLTIYIDRYSSKFYHFVGDDDTQSKESYHFASCVAGTGESTEHPEANTCEILFDDGYEVSGW